MKSDLQQKAIQLALESNWQQAIEINEQILKIDKDNVDALNRIARAYAENGNIEKAKDATEKVLKLDPLNAIANRCRDKWKNFKSNKTLGESKKVSANDFIEEPTTTKIVDLINLGEIGVINSLNCGDYLKLLPHPHRVNVTTQDNKYIGRFPDNLALKFISLMKLGGMYESIVKSADEDGVKIFVKSIARNEK